MPIEVHIDKTGRIVVPKKLRDDLGLAPGDNLLIDSDGEQLILRPAEPQPTLVKKAGIWVLQGTGASDESIPDLIDREREKRIREFF